ncbi:MAG: TIR domain-containing protein [Gammaproteobacteria bacterium]|nr:TIR domain-containing protein [Gammaproteobacteria bacterium]
MSDVFISYASEDRDQARRLAINLESNDWSVWWDRKIVTGQTFDQVIERELDKARCVVVLWSAHSVVSEWVKNEADVAAERGVLVPAVIDNVRLPLEFRRRQTADLVGWDGDVASEGYRALVDGIAAAMSEKPPPRPSVPQIRKPWWKRWVLTAIAPAVVLLVAGVYWAWGWRDSAPPVSVAIPSSGYRTDILRSLSESQLAAVDMLGQDKARAIAQIDQNLTAIDKALVSFPDDAELLALRGYAAKDVYQSSKNLLSTEKRREYLARARDSFERAIKLQPNSASAHNGLGNVLFFEGRFDAAISQHKKALRLSNGHYPAAEHDRRLVERVRDGEIPFEF